MFKTAVIITVYNRKKLTIRCLESLYNSIKRIKNHSFDIYLTDDKSTDGTFEAVKERFPKVNVLLSEGNLFWTRGMNLSWKYASKQKIYDYYIWLNDDVFLFENSLYTLINSCELAESRAIIGGAFRSEFYDIPTYGGILKKTDYNSTNNFLKPNGILQEFDLLSGNFVIIPNSIFKKVGIFDSNYHHGLGDFDYGLRAQKEGFKLFLSTEYVGYCERHDTKSFDCYDSKHSLFDRFRILYSPLGPNPMVNYKFFWKHYSLGKALKFLCVTHLITVFPFLLGKKEKLSNYFKQRK